MDTKIPDRYVKIILGILIGFFVLLCLLFVREYQRLNRLQLLGAHRFFSSSLIHKSLTSSDVSVIAPWMTFAYINTAFKIPNSFLQSTLAITDPRYPQISLAHYARTKNSASSALLIQVQDAVRGFLDAKK